MRRRRAERCLARAEAALAAGDEPAATAALAEAQELSPFDTPDLETLRSRVAPADAVVAAVTVRAEPQARWMRAAAAAIVVLGLILAGFALSTRMDRTPEVPASASVEGLASPPSAPPASPAVPAETPLPSTEVPLRPGAVVPASAPLVQPGVRLAHEEPRRVAYTPSPPTVGTTGSETLPAVLVAAPSVAVAAPEAPAAAPPEIPAAPLASGGAPAGSLAVTEPPPPPPSPPVEPRIRAVLSSYASAFGSLDASAVHRVWPGVDERSLARAFDGLSSQSLALGECAIAVRGDSATARCQGSTTWAPKVGGGSKTEARRWEFALREAGDSWLIVRADVR